MRLKIARILTTKNRTAIYDKSYDSDNEKNNNIILEFTSRRRYNNE